MGKVTILVPAVLSVQAKEPLSQQVGIGGFAIEVSRLKDLNAGRVGPFLTRKV